jgi:hypothetical protein
MKDSTTKHTIATHFLPACINADTTGLSDEEIYLLAEWETRYCTGNYVIEILDEGDYKKCEVTGLGSAVSTIAIIQICE